MKKLVSTILALTLCFSLPAAAFADNSSQRVGTTATYSAVSPLADETVWKYRMNNGVLEKRLWSNTYNKWLTDWIVVEPVD